jgi:hypothetical protein
MQTALNDLIEWCTVNAFNIEGQDGTEYLAIDYDDMRKLFDSLLAKERQQIVDAFDKGQRDIIDVVTKELDGVCLRTALTIPAEDKEDAEQYYSETFENKTPCKQ